MEEEKTYDFTDPPGRHERAGGSGPGTGAEHDCDGWDAYRRWLDRMRDAFPPDSDSGGGENSGDD